MTTTGPRQQDGRATVRAIKAAVAEYYGFLPHDLDGPWQSAPLVRARQVAIYLTRQMTLQSLPQIARAFGDRDHSTVMRGLARLEAALDSDDSLRADISALKTRISDGDDGHS